MMIWFKWLLIFLPYFIDIKAIEVDSQLYDELVYKYPDVRDHLGHNLLRVITKYIVTSYKNIK